VITTNTETYTTTTAATQLHRCLTYFFKRVLLCCLKKTKHVF